MYGAIQRKRVILRRSDPVHQELALQNRKAPTPAEARLWQRLRANRLDHLHFRRQHVLDGFIVDFYCHKVRLVIEIGEAIGQSQREQDEARDEYLAIRGLRTLRIKPDDIMERIEDVCARIAETCNGSMTDPFYCEPVDSRQPLG